jgi:putative NADH-flavin reductase
MRLFVLEGHSRTGQLLVLQALEAGHQVTTLDRDPGGVLSGHDAVIALGYPGSSWAAASVRERVGQLCQAMKASQVHRLLAASSWVVEEGPDLGVARMMMRLLGLRARHLAEEEEVRASELNWTLIRPPLLTRGGPTGAYRVSPRGLPPQGSALSYGDLAHFLLAEAQTPRYVHGTPTLAY